jgi:CubicO group peptidase (beta-lactamase class C family)
MSSAHDMAKWMKFHLSGGLDGRGHRVMSSATLRSTYKARNSISSTGISQYFSKPKIPHTTSEDNYALGWRNGHYRGIQFVISLQPIHCFLT